MHLPRARPYVLNILVDSQKCEAKLFPIVDGVLATKPAWRLTTAHQEPGGEAVISGIVARAAADLITYQGRIYGIGVTHAAATTDHAETAAIKHRYKAAIVRLHDSFDTIDLTVGNDSAAVTAAALRHANASFAKNSRSAGVSR